MRRAPCPRSSYGEDASQRWIPNIELDGVYEDEAPMVADLTARRLALREAIVWRSADEGEQA